MAVCKYCRKNAGWFSDHHDECWSKYNSVLATVSRGVNQTIKQGDDAALLQLKNLLKSLDRPASMSFSDVCLAAMSDWRGTVDKICYTDQVGLELTEEQTLFLIRLFHTLVSWLEPPLPNAQELVRWYSGQLTSLTVGETVRRICLGEGVDPLGKGDPRVDSINYLPGEFPVVAVQNVRIETEQTTYVRNYGGPSFRVAPGLYWRMGQSQGHVSTSFVVDEHVGYLILTNRGVYYSNAVTTMYVPCTQVLQHKILCLDPNNLAAQNAAGIILNLRNGRQIGFLIGSAHHSLCFVKLYFLAAAGQIHPR